MVREGTPGFTLLPTAIGEVGLAWSALGLTRILLPGSGAEAPLVRLTDELGAAARRSSLPPPLAPLGDAVARHLTGDVPRYEGVPLDLTTTTAFAARVYEATRRIPPGRARTYGAVAHALGDPNAARAVGAALSRNPFPLVVPCHRVVAADGSLRGFTAPGGVETKRALLALEGYRTPRS